MKRISKSHSSKSIWLFSHVYVSIFISVMNLNSNWLSYSKWEDRVTCFISSIWFIENYMKREFVISFFMCVPFIHLHMNLQGKRLVFYRSQKLYFQLFEIPKVPWKGRKKIKAGIKLQTSLHFSRFSAWSVEHFHLIVPYIKLMMMI